MIKVFYYNVDDVLQLYKNESPLALIYHLNNTEDVAIIPSLDDFIDVVVIDDVVVVPHPRDFTALIEWIRRYYPADDPALITISMEYLQELEAIRKEVGKLIEEDS